MVVILRYYKIFNDEINPKLYLTTQFVPPSKHHLNYKNQWVNALQEINGVLPSNACKYTLEAKCSISDR
jgi:hypothetical protein